MHLISFFPTISSVVDFSSHNVGIVDIFHFCCRCQNCYHWRNLCLLSQLLLTYASCLFLWHRIDNLLAYLLQQLPRSITFFSSSAFKKFKCSAKVMFEKSFIFSSEEVVSSSFLGKVTRIFYPIFVSRSSTPSNFSLVDKLISLSQYSLIVSNSFIFSILNSLTMFKTFIP